MVVMQVVQLPANIMRYILFCDQQHYKLSIRLVSVGVKYENK